MNKLITIGIGIAALTGASAAYAADAGANWAQYCASCHDQDGTAHGRVGRMLKVKDLTDAAYQKSFTDDEALKSIEAGLQADGHTRMKPFQDRLTDDESKALVAYVRTLAK